MTAAKFVTSNVSSNILRVICDDIRNPERAQDGLSDPAWDLLQREVGLTSAEMWPPLEWKEAETNADGNTGCYLISQLIK